MAKVSLLNRRVDDQGEPKLSKRYASRFYTEPDVQLFLGPYYLDNVIGFEYTMQNNKTPIYSYLSSQYDFVARGKEIVYGSFAINFRRVDMLQTIIDEVNKSNPLDISTKKYQEKKTIESETEDGVNKTNSTTESTNTSDVTVSISSSEYDEKFKTIKRYLQGIKDYIDNILSKDNVGAFSPYSIINDNQFAIFKTRLINSFNINNIDELQITDVTTVDMFLKENNGLISDNIDDSVIVILNKLNINPGTNITNVNIDGSEDKAKYLDSESNGIVNKEDVDQAIEDMSKPTENQIVSNIFSTNIVPVLNSGDKTYVSRYSRLDEHDMVNDKLNLMRFIRSNTFDLIITYGEQVGSGDSQDYPKESTKKVINDIHFIGEGQTITLDGGIIAQKFSFFARTIDEYKTNIIIGNESKRNEVLAKSNIQKLNIYADTETKKTNYANPNKPKQTISLSFSDLISTNLTYEQAIHSDTMTNYKEENRITDAEIIRNLQILSEHIYEPILAQFPDVVINSCYRCDKLNRMVNGAATSQHKSGQAIDLDRGSQVANEEMFDWVLANLTFDQMLGENNMSRVHISYVESGNRGTSNKRYRI